MFSKSLFAAALAAIGVSAFGFDPPAYDATYTTNGITYAQRGGLGMKDFVVTNIDANAVCKVKSVNGKTGDVSLDASDVGAATTAQGAKADAALSRTEAEAGFTDWKWTSTGPSITSVVWKASASQWVGVHSGGEWLFDPPNNTNFNATVLTSTDVQASRTRLIPEKWALSNVTNATGGAVAAADVRGIGIDYIAFPFVSGRDYAEGDVVTINDKFYRFNKRWRHQWSGSPIDEECVDELNDFAKLGGAVFAQQFLTLGWGGTNAPSYKKVHTGYENNRDTYFTISPSGIGFEDERGGKFRMVGDEFLYQEGNHEWDVSIRNILTINSVLPIRNTYLTDAYKNSPTSPYYVYAFLTNNYLTAYTVNADFLKKSDASSTYLSQTDAANTYATPSDVASRISTALANAKIQYLYNNYGNIRMRYDGVLQRQTHTGYNVNFTNEQSGVVFLYNGGNNWKALGTELGDLTVTRSNGVVVCTEYPIIRYTEDYPNTTVWQLAPLGTFRAVPNPYGTLSWDSYDTLVKQSEAEAFATQEQITNLTTAVSNLNVTVGNVEKAIPNNITRTGTDATLVHCDSGNCTNALVYIRQATSSLAGLMTATEHNKLASIPSDIATTASDALSLAQTATNDAANATAIVMSWENFLDGSNVVFSITNYISGAYTLETAKLKVLELRDGAYQEVYNSRDEILLHIDNFKANDFAAATNQVIGAVNAAIDGKADKAWGKYSSDGQNLQDLSISNTVYMTAPNTVFAGGLGYERVAVGQGAVCVLTTRGAPVWTQCDEGTFKFQDDGGTNYFGFVKTDSYTIGANTDGITVNSGILTLTYNITMSGRLCVWYKASLSDNKPWERLNLPDGSAVSGASHVVTWEKNPPDGSQVCYINCGNQPLGFFKATVEVEGEATKFITNMKADLNGGIICTNTATGVIGVIKPSYNGSTVIWTWSAN